MNEDTPKNDQETTEASEFKTPFSVMVKKTCSIQPNCGYFEIRSNPEGHCKRTTCNYSWALNAEAEVPKPEDLTEPCCPKDDQQKKPTEAEPEAELVDSPKKYVSNMNIDLQQDDEEHDEQSKMPETEIGLISYSHTSQDFKTPTKQKNKRAVDGNESDQNFSEFYETHDQKRKQPKPSGTNYCIPDTCDKLNPRKKRDKSCCRNPNCPINDANSSTYKFLLKVRMCCRKRGCQLAARICDIYEPLVKVDMDQTPENGDEKYHYLGKDDWTDYENIATSIETNHKWLELQEKEESAANFIRDYKKPDMNDIDMLRESVYVEPEKKEDRRRASTVSWHVSRTGSSDDLLVNKATEEAQKFRQGQQVTRAGSMFSTIMRQKDKDKDDIFDKPEGTLNYHTDSKFLLFKSQLDTVNPKVSHHRTQCWTAIKNKVRQRKKKKNPERRTSSIHWISNTDITDRKTLNIDAPTNIEKNAD